MSKIINRKLFVPLLILLSMMFIISQALGAELSQAGAPLLSDEHLLDKEAIETVIDQYFQIRYKVRATMQTQDFSSVLADNRDVDEFRQTELDRQEIEIHQAKLFGLDYVEYEFFIDVKDIRFNDEEGMATVILEEGHDVVFSSTQPVVSKMRNLEHIILLTNTKTGWKIVNDEYMDYLNRVLSETGMSKEGMIDSLDQSYEKFNEEINNKPSETTPSVPVPLISYNYNRSGAVSYAHQYAYNYNSAYHDFTNNDCTNFVSQAIHEGGGISEEDDGGQWYGWYYSSAANYASAWTGVQQLYDFITVPAGWNEGPTGYSATSIWSMATGDVIQYKWPGSNYWGHSVIVVTRTSGDPIVTVAAHDIDHDYYPYSYYIYGGIRYIHITGEW